MADLSKKEIGSWADVEVQDGPPLLPRQQHKAALGAMLEDRRQIAAVRNEARIRKNETARMAAQNVNKLQIFNVKYTANASAVAAAFNKVENAAINVTLNRKRPEQSRIPVTCLHNGSGLITFASSDTVQSIIEKAPLRSIKEKMVWIMYVDIAFNNVLHVKPYHSSTPAKGRNPGQLLLKGQSFDLCNWAAPSKLVVLHSEVAPLELEALDSKFVGHFQHKKGGMRLELAYKYLSGKAELHTQLEQPPYILFSLRIPPKMERLSDAPEPKDGLDKSSDMSAMLQSLREELQEKSLQWSLDPCSTEYTRTTDFTEGSFLGQCFVYRIQLSEEWRSKDKLQAIRNRLARLGMLHRGARPVSEVPRNLVEEQKAAELLATLNYTVWYYLECLVTAGQLSMQQVTQSFLAILKDSRVPEEVACQALALLLASKTKLTAPTKQLRRMVMDIMYDGRKLQELGRQLPEYCMLVRRCLITPTRVVRMPPETELSNRILRRYKDHADRFIRVAFGDEDSSTLHLGGRNQSKDIIERIRRLMKEGITVGGRTFHFLAFSTSQLRDQSAWCFSPLPFLSADQIRKEMGNFTHIKCVAKYAARMGQCFSSTVATVELEDKDFTRIDDVERNGYLFSDGCGLISEELADSVADVLKLKGRISLQIHRNPSAYQLRFGGCKGIVIRYPDRPELPYSLEGKRMLIRSSMEKFMSDGRNIELVGISRHHPAFLNRQIIVLLLGLGVKDTVFKDLQDAMLKTLEGIESSPQQARHVLQDYATIGSDEVVSGLLSMIAAGFDVTTEPYIKGLLATIRGHLLQELKNRTRIFVEEAAVLMGTMDEVGVLKEGEIFIQISPGPLQENPRIITGYTVVTKNPAFHPGDIRRLKAVDVPELHHLHNLVVFSQHGKRPPANEISGSDLDGDMFFCCWDKRLVPAKDYPAMNYSSPVAKELDRGVVIQDVADFFVDHAISDNLGIIANAHLATADQSPEGVLNEKCLALAQLHSDAVDFPKTGKVVEIPRELRPSQYPDFMQSKHRKSYQSTTIIGRLYREIQVPDNLIGQLEVGDCDEDLLCDEYKDFVHTAWNTRNDYEQQLIQIMSQFSVSDEFQLLSGCIIEWDKLYKRRTGKRYDTKTHITEAVQALQKKFMKIFDNELKEDYPDIELRQARATEKASAWYYVTYHPQYRGRETVGLEEGGHRHAHNLISFAWIPGRYLTELKMRKRLAREQELAPPS